MEIQVNPVTCRQSKPLFPLGCERQPNQPPQRL
jgi:hypothetical protein